ncbi:MAG: AraC family transcriptional regulator [Polyangiales bacterium]
MARVRLHDDLLRRISQVRERMHDESHRELRVTELARQACLSEQHFVRLFRTRYGVSPRRYLSGLRIEHAKLLLLRDFSVTEVCMAVGYTSLGTFSRRFALEMSCSPRSFQQQLRGFGAVPQRLAALYVPSCYLERFAPTLNVQLGEVSAAPLG